MIRLKDCINIQTTPEQVFTRLIYDVGIKSTKELVEITAEEFIRIYEEHEGKKADFGVSDIEFSLVIARELDIAVEL
jgi:hypothetical protein